MDTYYTTDIQFRVFVGYSRRVESRIFEWVNGKYLHLSYRSDTLATNILFHIMYSQKKKKKLFILVYGW